MPLQWRNLSVSVGVKQHEGRRRSVTSSGRVWRKVPESGARSVGSLVFNLGFRWADDDEVMLNVLRCQLTY